MTWRRQVGKAARESECGIVLIAVLWTLLLLGIVAASFLTTTRTETRLTQSIIEREKAAALAEAGVHRALFGLTRLSDEDDGWLVDGTVYSWRFGGGEVRIQVIEEGPKLDLNQTSPEVWQQALAAAGLEESIIKAMIDAIGDYADLDDFLRNAGAEDPDYASAGYDHGAKDLPFGVIEELQQVYGMTPELYAKLEPALTVYTRQPQPFVAPPTEKQLAEGLLFEEGRLFDAERFNLGIDASEPSDEQASGEEEQREPDFEHSGKAGEDGEPVEEESDPTAFQPQVLVEGSGVVPSGLPVFAIHSEARTPSDVVYARRAVVQMTNEPQRPYLILSWKQAARELFE